MLSLHPQLRTYPLFMILLFPIERVLENHQYDMQRECFVFTEIDLDHLIIMRDCSA